MHYNTKRLLLILPLFVLVLAGLRSQDGCALPPPTFISEVAVSSTTITVDWSPVTGAASYEVSAVDLSSNTLVWQAVVSTTTHMVEGLSPNREYEISVSASSCSNGPFGAPISLESKTSIIIVDIILQSRCQEGVPYSIQPNTSIQSETFFLSKGNCIKVAGEVLPNSSQIPFEVFIMPDHSTLSVHAGVPSNIAGHVKVSGNGPLFGEFKDANTTMGWEELFQADVFFQTNQGTRLELFWRETVGVSLNVCTECLFEGMEPLPKRSSGATETALFVSPNPSRDHIRFSLPSDTEQITIFDVNGKIWYQQSLNAGKHEIDIAHAPPGTYFIRTTQGQQTSQSRFIKQ